MMALTSSCGGAKSFCLLHCVYARYRSTHMHWTFHVHNAFSAFNFFDQNRKGYITADDVRFGNCLADNDFVRPIYHLSCFRCRLTFICLGEDMSEEEAVEFVTVNDRSGEKRLYFQVFEPLTCIFEHSLTWWSKTGFHKHVFLMNNSDNFK